MSYSNASTPNPKNKRNDTPPSEEVHFELEDYTAVFDEPVYLPLDCKYFERVENLSISPKPAFRTPSKMSSCSLRPFRHTIGSSGRTWSSYEMRDPYVEHVPVYPKDLPDSDPRSFSQDWTYDGIKAKQRKWKSQLQLMKLPNFKGSQSGIASSSEKPTEHSPDQFGFHSNSLHRRRNRTRLSVLALSSLTNPFDPAATLSHSTPPPTHTGSLRSAPKTMSGARRQALVIESPTPAALAKKREAKDSVSVDFDDENVARVVVQGQGDGEYKILRDRLDNFWLVSQETTEEQLKSMKQQKTYSTLTLKDFGRPGTVLKIINQELDDVRRGTTFSVAQTRVLVARYCGLAGDSPGLTTDQWASLPWKPGAKPARLQQLHRVFDRQRSGAVSLKDFLLACDALIKVSYSANLMFMFNYFDVNNTGVVTHHSLLQLCKDGASADVFVIVPFVKAIFTAMAGNDNLNAAATGIGYDLFVNRHPRLVLLYEILEDMIPRLDVTALFPAALVLTQPDRSKITGVLDFQPADSRFDWKWLLALWQMFDSVGDGGRVTKAAFSSILRNVFGITSCWLGSRLFHAFDLAHDNMLNFTEVLEGFSRMYRSSLPATIEFFFKMYDEDDNGVLDVDELYSLIKANVKMGAEREYAEEIMAKLASGDDSEVTVDQFIIAARENKGLVNILFP